MQRTQLGRFLFNECPSWFCKSSCSPLKAPISLSLMRVFRVVGSMWVPFFKKTHSLTFSIRVDILCAGPTHTWRPAINCFSKKKIGWKKKEKFKSYDEDVLRTQQGPPMWLLLGSVKFSKSLGSSKLFQTDAKQVHNS